MTAERPTVEEALRYAESWRRAGPSGNGHLVTLADEVLRLQPIEAAIRLLFTGTGPEVNEACETLRRLLFGK